MTRTPADAVLAAGLHVRSATAAPKHRGCPVCGPVPINKYPADRRVGNRWVALWGCCGAEAK